MISFESLFFALVSNSGAKVIIFCRCKQKAILFLFSSLKKMKRSFCFELYMSSFSGLRVAFSFIKAESLLLYSVGHRPT